MDAKKDCHLTIEFEKYDALDLAEQVARKEVTPAELVDVAISCIERVNGQLNCVNIENYEQARKTALYPITQAKINPCLGVCGLRHWSFTTALAAAPPWPGSHSGFPHERGGAL